MTLRLDSIQPLLGLHLPINPHVPMVFLHTYVANAGQVSQVLCHLEIKFQRLSHVFEGKLFNGPMPTFTGFLHAKIQDTAHKKK